MNQPLSCQSIVSSCNPELLVREIMTKLIYLMKGKCDVDIIIYSETCLNQTSLGQTSCIRNRQVFGLYTFI